MLSSQLGMANVVETVYELWALVLHIGFPHKSFKLLPISTIKHVCSSGSWWGLNFVATPEISWTRYEWDQTSKTARREPIMFSWKKPLPFDFGLPPAARCRKDINLWTTDRRASGYENWYITSASIAQCNAFCGGAGRLDVEKYDWRGLGGLYRPARRVDCRQSLRWK